MSEPTYLDVVRQAAGALREALEFHVHRDGMNAALHREPVRFSPLTLELRETLDLVIWMKHRMEAEKK